MPDPSIPVEAELTLFRPKLVKIKRRVSDRYRCGLATSGKLLIPGQGEPVTAWVYNLSVGGIGLNLPHALELGLEMVILLRVSGKAEQLRLPARVAHATQEVDHSWRVGCAFTEPLAADVLDALLE